MAVSDFRPHPLFVHRVWLQQFDFLNDTLEAHVLRATWQPDVGVDTLFGDVSAHVTPDADYAAVPLTGKVIYMDGNGNTVLDSADFDYGDTVSITGRYVVIAIADPDPTKRIIMGHWDCNVDTALGEGDVSSVSDDFDFKVNANGIYKIAPAVS